MTTDTKLIDVHGRLLSRAFERLLGGSDDVGAMAFVRCLAPEVVRNLALSGNAFAPVGWKVCLVAGSEDAETRSITADMAVELREAKEESVLLLVDTDAAGAGMDGIYSAAREVNEADLLDEAGKFARDYIREGVGTVYQRYAEQAIKKARGHGGMNAVSRWSAFDFLCRVAAGQGTPGANLHLLGLWPVLDNENDNFQDTLDDSRKFVDGLLGAAWASRPPSLRIAALRLDNKSMERAAELEKFLHAAGAKPLYDALGDLLKYDDLWVGNLRTVERAQFIQDIELIPWQTGGKVTKWSGLVKDSDDKRPPAYIINSAANYSSKFKPLEVRWKVRPDSLKKNAVTYRVRIVTENEDLASKEVPHRARKGSEFARFSSEDFSALELNENSRIEARVFVEVSSGEGIESRGSDAFFICVGDESVSETSGVRANTRTFSEGLAELKSRDDAAAIASDAAKFDPDSSNGFVSLQTTDGQGRQLSLRVARPSLIAKTDAQWKDGRIGRWKLKVRGSGAWDEEPRFEPLAGDDSRAWSQTEEATRRFAERFVKAGGTGQIYDETTSSFRMVREYLLKWADLLARGDPILSLVNTVEVMLVSGRIIGLIVLPSHPLRVAWHAAYDNLVLHAAFEQRQTHKDIGKEFAVLDGAMFPPFLPNPDGGAFVFADTLGFHSVGMVSDTDKEPKAAVAILDRAMRAGNETDTAPAASTQGANALAEEIVKYLDCHETSRLVHVHALRAGDGFTVARALGGVRKQTGQTGRGGEEGEEEPTDARPIFSLDLYPSLERRSISGRFIAEALEKRRRRAGVLSHEDLWMQDSMNLPGGINVPCLRWARKEVRTPSDAAHLAIAFNTFDSHVVADLEAESSPRSRHAFGLMSFYDRHYTNQPTPTWTSAAVPSQKGEAHPSASWNSKIISRVQDAVQRAVSQHLGEESGLPVLKTEISGEKTDELRKLHRLCDWVVSLDRIAGIEYFDSPQSNRETYDAYVIDCVPERDDLDCLQLVTSTANLGEIRNLLDDALDRMGLTRSRRNAEFLLGHLKALSGRLAIRLTGHKLASSELIALAASHASCQVAQADDECWCSLKDGFFVPVDDVRDLLPISNGHDDQSHTTGARPDLIFVTTGYRKGLTFRFLEVKYRGHLVTARAPDVLKLIRKQTRNLRAQWERRYCDQELCASFRAIRRAKLARVLRFYADKAHRHGMPAERYRDLMSEIDRMIKSGGDYKFAKSTAGDRGWVFCPEYRGALPQKISPESWDMKIFMFGPAHLPDSEPGYEDQHRVPNDRGATNSSEPGGSARDIGSRRAQNGGNKKSTTGSDHSVVKKEDSKESVDPSESGNTEPPAVKLGTNIITNATIGWHPRIDGNPHLLIAGLPGMGKTTCLVNLCRQLNDADVRPLVFSFHQDIDEKIEAAVGSVRFVNYAGLGFNPLRVIDRNAHGAHLDVAGSMRDIFTAIYPELGDIQANGIRTAIKESFEESGWSASAAGESEPAFKRFVEILRADPKPGAGLKGLLARLDELEDYGFFESGDDPQGSLWDSKQPVVIRIHSTQNDNLQKAFAYLVFYGLYKDMFLRGLQNRITHALIFDEAHRAARLKLLPTMAKECRKFGISLVLASQEAKDFDASMFSAIANYLVLRSTDADAKFLVKNVADSKMEKLLVDRIKQMEKFKAYYFAEGDKRPAEVALSP